jgi:uncharacterized protein (TIGR00725 family)
VPDSHRLPFTPAGESTGRTLRGCGSEPAEATSHATVVVATGVGQARNLAVAASGEVAIAIGDGYGTLSEIALARKLGRRVVVLDGPEVMGTERASSPLEAVELALRRP